MPGIYSQPQGSAQDWSGAASPRGGWGGANHRRGPFGSDKETSTSMALLAVIGLLLVGTFGGILIALGETTAAFLCLSLLASVFILLDYRVGVFILILFVPVSQSTYFPRAMFDIKGLNPLNCLLAATLASYVLHRLSNKGMPRFVPPRLLWLYIVPFVIAGLIGSRHVNEIAPYFLEFGHIQFDNAVGYARDVVMKPLLLVLFSLLVGAAVARAEKPERFIIPMLVSVWVLGLLVVGFFVAAGVSIGSIAGEYARTFLNPVGMHANDLGRLYATAYALLLFTWAATEDKNLKLLLLPSMGLMVLALILTLSRGAFLGFIVVNVIFLFSRRDTKAMLFGGLLGFAALLVLPGAVMYRMSLGFGSGGDFNTVSAGRVEGIWLPLLPELWHSPVWGNGLVSILWSDAMRAGAMFPVIHPHNAYLQVLFDMGVVGLVLILAWYLHAWRGLRKLHKDETVSPTMRGFFDGAAAGLVSILVAGMAGSSLFPVTEQAFLWMAIGMMYGYHARPKVN
jgi:O-antigen ligase